MKKILITGSGGFIGKNLVEYFADKDYIISAPARNELDLTDEAKVAQYLCKGKYDVVIHTANTRPDNINAGDILNTNLRMFYNLERAHNEYGRLIYFGSGAEYDRRNILSKVNEEQFGLSVPQDAYGFTKYLMHKTTEWQSKIYELCIFGVYGQYEMWERRFISNNIVRSLKGLPMTLTQNAYFDYLYIKDLCQIVEWFVNNEPLYKHYNVCTSQPIDLLSLAHMINEVSDEDREIIIGKEGYKAEYSGDNSRLLKEIGNYTFSDKRSTISELWAYYKTNIDKFDVNALL